MYLKYEDFVNSNESFMDLFTRKKHEPLKDSSMVLSVDGYPVNIDTFQLVHVDKEVKGSAVFPYQQIQANISKIGSPAQLVKWYIVPLISGPDWHPDAKTSVFVLQGIYSHGKTKSVAMPKNIHTAAVIKNYLMDNGVETAGKLTDLSCYDRTPRVIPEQRFKQLVDMIKNQINR